jgi:hypothetical protein
MRVFRMHDNIVDGEASPDLTLTDDQLAERLIAAGWADKQRGSFSDLDAEQRAMAAKLLAPPPDPVKPTCRWRWTANSLGRQWHIVVGRNLLCRGFTDESLNTTLRKMKDNGCIIERGIDTVAGAA